jgi:hypothetical protein
MKQCVIFLGFILLSVGIASAGQSLLNVRAPEFTISDQYDRHYSLQSLSGRPLVLIASDKEGEEQNRQWGALIRGKCGNSVRILGVADVRAVPFFLKGKIRNDFRKDPNSILLDWKGTIFESFGLVKGVSNVVLIDGSGSIRYMYAGAPADEARERLFKEIESMLHRK